jgi:DNA polymerase-3 subunit gamma/tau
MSYQVLARKYRPQKFSEVIGQEHVTRTLKNAIEQGRIAHGYIFSGHRGIGKTTIARILAMALNCRSAENPVAEPCEICESCTEIRAGNSVDVIEIDAATNRGIDEIRELREAARYRPARDRYKIYILDEAHQITDAAFNALLKTLEEPPGHVVFMMATTEPEDIPQTIRSRCQHFSFHAVKFEDIMGQLRDLVGRENIEADEDALALLAEAGDGSMRDALSILDQAIASREGKLTAESVRQLVGAAPSGISEEVMQAVARSASDEILRIVDKLLSEGHNPTHFARQMVRFLRNAVVAKVAGRDSSLLQISSDERDRVTRVAELFSEEDLTRHLQIMLRTHAELGYRQEQRFHLELGLLKLSHAQRLLPLEQLLSEGASSTPVTPRPQVRSTTVTEPRRPETPSPGRAPFVSPFAADSARKGGIKTDMSTENAGGPRLVTQSSPMAPVVMGSAAPVVQETTPVSDPLPEAATAPEIRPEAPPDQAQGGTSADSAPAKEDSDETNSAEAASGETRLDEVRIAVLNALSGHQMLASRLETGEWQLQGNELVIKVAASATVIDMTLGPDAKKLIVAAASGVLKNAAKLKVLPGAVPQAAARGARPTASAPSGSARSRVEQDPLVQRMKEKFGAEIRTIIDYREKR